MIIVGDIGGTKADLAICEYTKNSFKCSSKKRYATQQYDSFTAMLKDFLGSSSVKGLDSCFGVAGPINQGRSQVVNIKWPIVSQDVMQEMGLKTAWLINDLEAIAYGIGALSDCDFITLNQGTEIKSGNAAVIAAGTGLGEAGLFWNGKVHHPFPSEGGHCNYAPINEEEIELLRYLTQKLKGHVSYERVVSGPGIYNIYTFLRDTGREEEPESLRAEMQGQDPPIVISKCALEGSYRICVRALDIFIANYGAEAGNLALKYLPRSGLYIAGGIAPKLLPKMQEPTFMQAFSSKGRFRTLLETIPIKIVNNKDVNLLGAARYTTIHSRDS